MYDVADCFLTSEVLANPGSSLSHNGLYFISAMFSLTRLKHTRVKDVKKKKKSTCGSMKSLSLAQKRERERECICSCLSFKFFKHMELLSAIISESCSLRSSNEFHLSGSGAHDLLYVQCKAQSASVSV